MAAFLRDYKYKMAFRRYSSIPLRNKSRGELAPSPVVFAFCCVPALPVQMCPGIWITVICGVLILCPSPWLSEHHFVWSSFCKGLSEISVECV